MIYAARPGWSLFLPRTQRAGGHDFHFQSKDIPVILA
jgi:hypothetical protein